MTTDSFLLSVVVAVIKMKSKVFVFVPWMKMLLNRRIAAPLSTVGNSFDEGGSLQRARRPQMRGPRFDTLYLTTLKLHKHPLSLMLNKKPSGPTVRLSLTSGCSNSLLLLHTASHLQPSCPTWNSPPVKYQRELDGRVCNMQRVVAAFFWLGEAKNK